MESQMGTGNKVSGVMMDGGGGGGGGGARSSSSVGAGDLVLRVLALVLTLTAAVLLGVDKQTKVVPVVVSPNLPPLNVPVTAKWHYLSAFVYFVVSNAIACTYSAISLLLVIASKGGKRNLGAWIVILDLLMVALLFSGNGAATAVGIIGYKGNSHVRWNKVCNVFGKFCNQVAASIAVSLLASLAFVVLVIIASFRLHRKFK